MYRALVNKIKALHDEDAIVLLSSFHDTLCKWKLKQAVRIVRHAERVDFSVNGLVLVSVMRAGTYYKSAPGKIMKRVKPELLEAHIRREKIRNVLSLPV